MDDKKYIGLIVELSSSLEYDELTELYNEAKRGKYNPGNDVYHKGEVTSLILRALVWSLNDYLSMIKSN